MKAQDIQKIKESSKINWMGLDFTKAKMIGSLGFKNPAIVCNRYIHSKWNAILLKERNKYNISAACGYKVVEHYFDVVSNRNIKITPNGLVTDLTYSITQEDVVSVIQEYPQIIKDGVSMVFIVESFNKNFESGNIWVVFFDGMSKDIHFCQKYQTKPGGFGILNYWIRTVYNLIKDLKRDYLRW